MRRIRPTREVLPDRHRCSLFLHSSRATVVRSSPEYLMNSPRTTIILHDDFFDVFFAFNTVVILSVIAQNSSSARRRNVAQKNYVSLPHSRTTAAGSPASAHRDIERDVTLGVSFSKKSMRRRVVRSNKIISSFISRKLSQLL